MLGLDLKQDAVIPEYSGFRKDRAAFVASTEVLWGLGRSAFQSNEKRQGARPAKNVDFYRIGILYGPIMGIPFLKMHGLGNDFVVLDARETPLSVGEFQARAIANRNTGVGCDQLIVIEPSTAKDADAFMRIYNADGSEVDACGNATRCVGSLIMSERSSNSSVIETGAGLLHTRQENGGLVRVDMGEVKLNWADIPASEEVDTLHLGLEVGALKDPVGVNVGNPHAVFFVEDAAAIPLAELGPTVEHHSLFPERVNVGVAQIQSRSSIRLRVWERGAGITQACGTGACAALIAASRRDLTDRTAEVVLDGGALTIEWAEDNHVHMTGPVATSFSGTLNDGLMC
jgi:diaminopimelate epimerase